MNKIIEYSRTLSYNRFIRTKMCALMKILCCSKTDVTSNNLFLSKKAHLVLNHLYSTIRKSLLIFLLYSNIKDSQNSRKILRHLFQKKKKIADSSGLLKMEYYMKKQLFFIIQKYFKNNEDLIAIIHSFRTKYDRNSDLI